MNLLSVLLPLFLCVGAGALMARWRKLDPAPFVSAVMDVFMPALVFHALITATSDIGELVTAAGASVFNITLLVMLCVTARSILGARVGSLRQFALPVLFMNAGFLGIPLAQLAFGNEAVGRMVVFDQVQTLAIFTVGVWIAMPLAQGGGGHGTGVSGILAESARAFLHEPLIYAILIGGGCRVAGWIMPDAPLSAIEFIGRAASPVALFSLGLRLGAPLRASDDVSPSASERRGRVAWIVLLRFVGGLACGLIVVTVLSLEGLTRQVVLTASTLPSAVFSYILAERYNADPDVAARAVFVSTVLSLAIIPLVLLSI